MRLFDVHQLWHLPAYFPQLTRVSLCLCLCDSGGGLCRGSPSAQSGDTGGRVVKTVLTHLREQQLLGSTT